MGGDMKTASRTLEIAMSPKWYDVSVYEVVMERSSLFQIRKAMFWSTSQNPNISNSEARVGWSDLGSQRTNSQSTAMPNKKNTGKANPPPTMGPMWKRSNTS